MSKFACLIHVVKRSKITIFAREKKRGLSQQPCAGKHDWEDRGKLVNLSTLRQIQASTSITPFLALLPSSSGMPFLYN
jgi:hypothetical protein